MRKSYVVLGAGGLGRDLLSIMGGLPGDGIDFVIRALMDSRDDPALFATIPTPFIGPPTSALLTAEDEVLVAVGNMAIKQVLVQQLQARNACFGQFIVEPNTVGARSTVGASIVARGVRISADVKIGDFVYLDSDVSIGHDVLIEDFCHIGSRVFLAGGVHLGKGALIHPCAAIAKDVRIGEGAIVGLGAIVTKDVPPFATVFGNPARVIFVQPN